MPKPDNLDASSRKVVISIDLDEWYHSRWVTGSEISIWKDTQAFFKEYYGTDHPNGELTPAAEKVLTLFDEFQIRATFFVLGEVAEYYRDLVIEIHRRGHEIACHGFYHFDLFLYSPERFEGELRQAKQLLEEITGDEVVGYRAPNLIIEPWVMDVLERLGFKYDSSVCPSRTFFGKYKGLMDAPQNPYRLAHGSLAEVGQRDLYELPIPTFPGLRIPAATGIATRVIGKWWTKTAIKAALRNGVASYYFHPYEIYGQPELQQAGHKTKLFMRRTGTWMETRLRELFSELDAEYVTACDTVSVLSSSDKSSARSDKGVTRIL